MWIIKRHVFARFISFKCEGTQFCAALYWLVQPVQFTVDLRIFKPTPFPSPHHTFCDCYSSFFFFIGKFKWKLLQLQDQCYINTWKDAFGTQDISTNFCYLPSLKVNKILLTSKRTFLNFLIANPTLDSQFEEPLIMHGALSCLLLAYRVSLVQTSVITEDNRCDTPTHVSCVFRRNDSQRPLYTWPWHHQKSRFKSSSTPSISFPLKSFQHEKSKKEHAHTKPQSVPPFVITPTKRLSSSVTHKQGVSVSPRIKLAEKSCGVLQT